MRTQNKAMVRERDCCQLTETENSEILRSGSHSQCFDKSFPFLLDLKNSLTKGTTCLLLTNKQFQFFFFFIEDWLNKSNGVYITKVGQPTSRPESVGLSIVNSSLQSQLGKGPGRCSHTMVETSNCSMGAPAYNPRPKPDVIISLHMKIQLWFSFYNAVCFTLWIIRLLRLQRA